MDYKLDIINFIKDAKKGYKNLDEVSIDDIKFDHSEIKNEYLHLYILFDLYAIGGQEWQDRQGVIDSICCGGTIKYFAALSIKLNMLDKYLNEPFIIDKDNTDYILEGNVDYEIESVEVLDGPSKVGYDVMYGYVEDAYDRNVSDITKWINNHAVKVQIVEE